MGFLPCKKSLLTLFVLIIGFCLFCSGCSFLTLETRYIAETNNSEWLKKTINHDSYSTESVQYQNIDVLLTVPSCIYSNSYHIAIGPPMFPIFPGLLAPFTSERNLYFTFIIDNSGDTIILDLQGIKLITSEGRVVTHEKAHSCAVDNDYDFNCLRVLKEYQTFKDSPVIIKKGGKFKFQLYYPNIDSQKELKVEFGQGFEERNAKLPQLLFRREYDIHYCPLGI